MLRSLPALVLTNLLLASSLAKADTLNFSFHGESGEVPGQFINEAFSLPSSPTPVLFGTFGSKTGFYLENVAVTGDDFFDPSAEAIFYTDGSFELNGGGDLHSPYLDFFGDGTPSFIGPVSAPTFVPGAYTITGTTDGSSLDTPGVLTVSDPSASPVPEPSTIALLGTGLLGVAGALRRRLPTT